MKSIMLRIRDDDKARDLIQFLKDISFVDIEEQDEVSTDQESGEKGLNRLYGLWEGRDITLSDIRREAWNYRGVSDDIA